jgi:hypothetical protein
VRQFSDEATTDTLHAELCAAIADLAKSVEVAVTRMALRARCTTAIADAATAEHAAELLRVASVHSKQTEEQQKATLVPLVAAPRRQDNLEENTYDCDAIDSLYGACQWLAAAQVPRTAPRADACRDESKIAMRILELQDRFGGLIKK